MSEHDEVGEMLHHLEHLLPAQRPIEAFVHHNTLHQFEHMPFHEAVVHAARLYNAEPYMPENAFRDAWKVGRILEADVDHVLAGALPDEKVDLGAVALPLRELVKAWMLGLADEDDDDALSWRLEETDELDSYPADLPRRAFERLVSHGPARVVQHALWATTEATVVQRTTRREPRHVRDLLDEGQFRQFTEDVDGYTIRWCAAYLDGGQGYWPMGDKDQGFYHAMLTHLAQPGLHAATWVGPLVGRAQLLLSSETPALTSIRETLERMGVPRARWEDHLRVSLLSLPGWPGMFVQLAARPDLAPTPPPPTRLEDYVAIRLLVEEARARQILGVPKGPLSWEPLKVPPRRSHTWRVFGAARLAGMVAQDVNAKSVATLEALLERYDGFQRRGLWQEAYERRYRIGVLDGILAHHARLEPTTGRSSCQIVTCIDDREESLRRHLEELRPDYETFGAAAFYGVAAYVKRLNTPERRPLCPANLIPEHALHEVPADGDTSPNRTVGKARELAWVGSNTLLRG
ncbi:MAG: DUF2309 family protein, partial [Myxococcales bacterium]|nr:DUF2309 family protein [Myxococcales bacterium]